MAQKAKIALKIAVIEQCGNVDRRCHWNPADFKGQMGEQWRYRTPHQKDIAEFALAKLEEYRALDVAAHEKNLEGLKTNILIKEKVTAAMNETGMPHRYHERDPKSRARFPKLITRNAGWVDDLARIVTSDSFENATQRYETFKVRYTDFLEQGKRSFEFEASAKTRKDEADKAKRLEDVELVKIILRYDMDPLSTWDSVYSLLRQKDHLLDLAIAMMNVRNNWSDGPDEVVDALAFMPRNAVEQEIKAEAASHCEDFEDGHVFRDCRWSYDVILKLVKDEQLVKDAMLARDVAMRD